MKSFFRWAAIGFIAGIIYNAIRYPLATGCLFVIAILVLIAVALAMWPWGWIGVSVFVVLYYYAKKARQMYLEQVEREKHDLSNNERRRPARVRAHRIDNVQSLLLIGRPDLRSRSLGEGRSRRRRE
jgi:hypothetical protein